MTWTIEGSCHCGNVTFGLVTDVSAERITARACDCSFCRVHGAKNWSDPKGTAIIRVRESAQLQRYLFALRTADFLVCKTCGAYVGAVLSDDEGSWSTLNLRLSNLYVEEESASYGSERSDDRISRRRRSWTPTTVVVVT